MAGQTSAQKAAAERTAAEKAAAEKAAAEREAAEKAAAARAEAANTQAPAVPAAEPDRSLYTVTGAAVVLRTDDGFERYLYRGAVVDGAAFSQDSIDHAISNNLIAGTE